MFPTLSSAIESPCHYNSRLYWRVKHRAVLDPTVMYGGWVWQCSVKYILPVVQGTGGLRVQWLCSQPACI